MNRRSFLIGTFSVVPSIKLNPFVGPIVPEYRNTIFHRIFGIRQKFRPIIMSLVKRMMPVLLAYDICGTMPMTGPTGLIPTLRVKYNDNHVI